MNLEEWLTETQAAEVLGLSTRTIRRMAKEGQLRRELRPIARRKPEAVYHPEDVQGKARKLLAERRPAALTVMAPDAPAPAPPPVPASTPGFVEALEHLAAALGRSNAAPPLWMTLDQAARYSGLSHAFLERLVAQRKVRSVRDRSVKIRRSDLDSLDFK